MPRHEGKRLSKPTTKFWLAAGGLLGVSLLPCPECGTPMIFHAWPLVGMVLLAQAIKKRTRKEKTALAGGAHNPVVTDIVNIDEAVKPSLAGNLKDHVEKLH